MDASTNVEKFDVVVIGAGLSGIIAARRYLQAHPDSKLTILEQSSHVGGVWGAERVYPGFWTQWTYGVAEFYDLPMERPPPKDIKHGQFKAEYSTRYFEGYVDHMTTAGCSLRDRLQFNTRVWSATKTEDCWRLTCTVTSGAEKLQKEICAKRLIVASGFLPNMPNLPGKETFDGTIFHSNDFAQSTLMNDESMNHIGVLGAGKSAADMVYAAVKAGKTVSWIIRKSGAQSRGPAFFAPADLPTPYENAGLGAQTRVMASLQPTFLNADTWWTRFLHGTHIGVRLVNWIFSKADAQIRKRAAYREREGTKGFEKLEYETDLFWQNGTGGVVHQEDFWPLVAENVWVHRAGVKMLNRNELYLEDDEVTHFRCDAILCGTGWKHGLDIFAPELRMKLGLPYLKKWEPRETSAKWEKLVLEADEAVLKKFLILRNPPKHPHKREDSTPYRLYRGMAPLNDNSIVFMNHVSVANKLFAAEAQAMWAVAYFDNNIEMRSIQEKEKDIAMWIAWCRRRYLSNGELGNNIVFDGVPYVDMLLRDMGLTAHLKKGWLHRFFAPFRTADLGRAWEEYLQKNSK